MAEKENFTSHIVKVKLSNSAIEGADYEDFTSHIVKVKPTVDYTIAQVRFRFTSHIVKVKRFRKIRTRPCFELYIPHS